jgi:putative membrane protein
MRKTFAVALAVAALSVTPALAQTQSGTQSGQGQSPKSASATTASGNLAATDRTFVKEAATGGLAEVELGNLAKDKASSADVKQFGERMVTDHSKANDELKQWAEKNNVTLPTQLSAKDKATRDRLAKLSGAAFDKAYMHQMVMDHQKDVAAFKHASQTAKNADLKAWAGETLPTLQDHMKLAQDTAGKVGASAATSGHKAAHQKQHPNKKGSGGR